MRKPEKLGAYYFGCLLICECEECREKIYIFGSGLRFVDFRMEIIPDKDQLYYVLTTDTIK